MSTTEATPSTTGPWRSLSTIHAGMRLRSTLAGIHNQIIVTSVTPTGFAYRIADDEEIINPHWSMPLTRDGHEDRALDGKVCWEPVLS